MGIVIVFQFKVQANLIIFSHILAPVVLKVDGDFAVEIFYLLLENPVILFPEKTPTKPCNFKKITGSLITFDLDVFS